MKKTYATSMPNHIGAFLKASKCFAALDINITRVSYDNSVDSHMLFLDVEGTEEQILKADAELEKIGPPVEGQYKPVFEGLMAQRRLLKKYGGHSTKKGGYFSGTVMPILTSPELSIRDKIGTANGYKVCLSQMWPTIVRYDFLKDCGPFRMPYYIFQGRLDQNTPASLVQAFYDSIEAPDKDLVWFEHSAHGPMGEEPEKFKKLMREKFLTIAQEAAK